MGGAEQVLSTFFEIFKDADLYTTFCDQEAFRKRYPNLPTPIVHSGAQRRYNLLSKIPIIGKRATKLFLKQMPRYMEDMDLSAYDLVIANSGAWSHGLITPSHTNLVVYMHSPMRFAWDHTHETMDTLGAKEGTARRMWLTGRLRQTRMWDVLASQRQSLLLCNSRTVQRRIEKFYRREDSMVVYPPIDMDALPFPKDQNKEEFLLLLGTLTRYKNLDGWIKYCSLHKIPLVVAGDGPDRKRLESMAGPGVLFTGYLSEEEKLHYLSKARALLYPSKEDFGMLPLEAMAVGTPPVCLGQGGALETVEHMTTGIHYAANTPEHFEKALKDLKQFEHHAHPMSMRRAATAFSKDRFKKEIRAVLKEQLGIHPDQYS